MIDLSIDTIEIRADTTSLLQSTTATRPGRLSVTGLPSCSDLVAPKDSSSLFPCPPTLSPPSSSGMLSNAQTTATINPLVLSRSRVHITAFPSCVTNQYRDRLQTDFALPRHSHPPETSLDNVSFVPLLQVHYHHQSNSSRRSSPTEETRSVPSKFLHHSQRPPASTIPCRPCGRYSCGNWGSGL
jgi:hypothetical protein